MEQVFDTDTLNSKISLFPGLHEISRNVTSRKTSLPQLFLTLVSETETLSCRSCQGQQLLSPSRIQVSGRNQGPPINPCRSLLQGWELDPQSGAEPTLLINTYHLLVECHSCNSPCLFLEETGHGCSSDVPELKTPLWACVLSTVLNHNFLWPFLPE